MALRLRYRWAFSINDERFSRPFKAPKWITTATSTYINEVYVPVRSSTVFTFLWKLLPNRSTKCVNGARFKILYTNFCSPN
jgi:hypothetical protein